MAATATNNSELDQQDRTLTLLAQELHLPIEREELQLLYQPQVHIDSGHIVGLESRVRWNHPTCGTIKRSVFIPIAEVGNHRCRRQLDTRRGLPPAAPMAGAGHHLRSLPSTSPMVS
jgi:predicted signal transduction protein with EAL and GGDEF domain